MRNLKTDKFKPVRLSSVHDTKIRGASKIDNSKKDEKDVGDEKNRRCSV